MNNNFNNIKILRVQKGWSQSHLGEKLNMQASAISKKEKGEISLKQHEIQKLASIFGVSELDIMGKNRNELVPVSYTMIDTGEDDVSFSAPTLPFMGKVGAGIPATFDSIIDELQLICQDSSKIKPPQIAVPFHVKNGFVLQVVGDSLNKRIPDGYYVAIDLNIPDYKYLNGRVVFASVADEGVTLKIWNNTLQQLEPDSTDDTYKPIRFKIGSNDYSIHGVVVQAFMNYGI